MKGEEKNERENNTKTGKSLFSCGKEMEISFFIDLQGLKKDR